MRDRLWLWALEPAAGSPRWGLPGLSTMSPAEGADYLGVPNLIMVRYQGKPAPPFHQFATALHRLKRVIWSIVGVGGSTEAGEVGQVVDLASRFPNICGVIMDDFFNVKREDGSVGTFTPEELATIREQLVADGRRLELWVVLYEHQLELPVGAHLEECDVVTYWTWWPERLRDLEGGFERLERLAPRCRKVLGCYAWDYSGRRPMPVELMERQCELGLRWLRQGRIEGMIVGASELCDQGLEAVEWTRRWIQQVGAESVPPSQ